MSTEVTETESARGAEPKEGLATIIEALLLAADQPLSLDAIFRLFQAEGGITKKDVRAALDALAAQMEGRAIELREVAGGFRLQVRAEHSEWVSRLWQERPPRFSRALLETLALICYRQPVTRGEIEEIRGVSLSPNIIKTLQERGWVREVGVKDVPGRPALLGTTTQFLDDFNLRALDELPTLPEIKDPQQLEAALAKLGQAVPLAAQAAVAEGDGAATAAPAPSDTAAAEAGAPATPEVLH